MITSYIRLATASFTLLTQNIVFSQSRIDELNDWKNLEQVEWNINGMTMASTMSQLIDQYDMSLPMMNDSYLRRSL